jgi:predicted  nucleic acid-binding Zn-ribbon protein
LTQSLIFPTAKSRLLEAKSAPDAIREKVRCRQQRIGELTSDNFMMQSRIAADEEKTTVTEELIKKLSAQVANEQRQMQTDSLTYQRDIHTFCTEVRHKVNHIMRTLSPKLSERMEQVRKLHQHFSEKRST